jgi:hypothetical protein
MHGGEIDPLQAIVTRQSGITHCELAIDPKLPQL